MIFIFKPFHNVVFVTRIRELQLYSVVVTKARHLQLYSTIVVKVRQVPVHSDYGEGPKCSTVSHVAKGPDTRRLLLLVTVDCKTSHS